MPARIELEDKRFGKWLVLKEAPSRPNSNLRRYNVVCDCGTRKDIAANELTRSKSASRNCGCEKANMVRSRSTTHGLRYHIGYSRYHAMMARCYDPNHKEYNNYGGRGITVFRPWRHPAKGLARYCSFIDMLPGYVYGMEIDRIDNNLGYKPNNIRWVTRQRNINNRRKTFMVSYRGRNIPITELCASKGITDYGVIAKIRERIKLGWSVQKALNV